jgi:hypothetical protein
MRDVEKVEITTDKGKGTLVLEQPYVISAEGLSNLINSVWDVKIVDLANLFWEGDYANDCYKTLYFRDGKLPYASELISEHYSDSVKAKAKMRNIVREFLDRYIREDYPYEYILVDVSW